jgi:hypothetical protein
MQCRAFLFYGLILTTIIAIIAFWSTMPTINIKGTILELPDSASSPNWAPNVVEFFKLVADAINGISGAFDVAPQTFNIDAFNNATDEDIQGLLFPPSDVRSSVIIYAVYRETEETTLGQGDNQAVSEAGTLEIVYNDSTGLWSMTRMGVEDAMIDFGIDSNGQVTFSTQALTGINHTGIITFRALAVLNT